MKSYIFLIAFVLAVAQVQCTILEELIQTDQKCRAESGISEQDIREILSLKATKPAKCYLKCFLQSEGFWKNKKFNKQAVLDILAKFKPLQKFEGIVSTVLDQCQDIKESDDCEAAFAASTCIVINGIKTVGSILADLLFAD